jgi:DNA-binding transcriptional regulator YhcF (GntR family)
MSMDKLGVTMLYQVTHDLPVSIDHEGDVPVYIQLADILRARIESGELAPRGRCRPTDADAGLRRGGGTIDKALGILRAEGLVRTVIGRGIYVPERAESRIPVRKQFRRNESAVTIWQPRRTNEFVQARMVERHMRAGRRKHTIWLLLRAGAYGVAPAANEGASPTTTLVKLAANPPSGVITATGQFYITSR